MDQITPAVILAFARTLQGRTLHTLHKPAPFTLEVQGDQIVYTTQRGGERLPTGGDNLRDVCTIFTETNSLSPNRYKKSKERSGPGSVFATYTLPVIVKYLASIVDQGTTSDGSTTLRPLPELRTE